MPSPRADVPERDPVRKMRASARIGAALCLSLSGLACGRSRIGETNQQSGAAGALATAPAIAPSEAGYDCDARMSLRFAKVRPRPLPLPLPLALVVKNSSRHGKSKRRSATPPLGQVPSARSPARAIACSSRARLC
jgi:hypothetical protein